MKLLSVLVASAALALPLAAHAADFSGPYVGANVGYGLGDIVIDDQDCDVSCSSQNFTPNGLSLGGVIGFNHQMGAGVVGLEGDYNWIDASADKVTDWPSHHHAEIKSYGSIRARAGLAVDNALIYATGGLAIVNQDILADDLAVNPASHNGFHASKTQVGLAAGAGAEYQMSQHVRLKMEYLYLGVPGEDNIHDQFNVGGFCSTHTYCNFGYKTHLNVVRFGVNWAF